jgi:hypothetical protein
MNADKVASDLVPKSVQRVGPVTFKSERSVEDGAIVKRITVTDGNDEHRYIEHVAAYMPSDLKRMVANAGFRVTGIFGKDMEEDVEQSDRCVIVARKP